MQTGLEMERQPALFAHLSPEYQDRVAAGIRSLCGVEDTERERIIVTSISLINRYRPTSARPDQLAELLGNNDIPDANIFFAVMALVPHVFSRDSHQATVELLHAQDILGAHDREDATAVLNVIADHYAEGRDNIRRMSIESEVLPYLMEFEATVDIRLEFGARGNSVELAVPLAMIHVDTDSYRQEIWFQAGIAQVETMIERLQLVAERMKSAEDLARKLHSSG